MTKFSKANAFFQDKKYVSLYSMKDSSPIIFNAIFHAFWKSFQAKFVEYKIASPKIVKIITFVMNLI